MIFEIAAFLRLRMRSASFSFIFPPIEGRETASFEKLIGLLKLMLLTRSVSFGRLSSTFESIRRRFFIFKVSKRGGEPAPASKERFFKPPKEI
jgi:hypothetical protein